MFTSRAEYRLSLRADNADQRLTPRGIALGCVGAERRAAFTRKQGQLEAARHLVQAVGATPATLSSWGIAVRQDGVRRTALDLLAYPGMTIARLSAHWPDLAELPVEIAEQIEIEGVYAGYLDRQEADVQAFKRDEELSLPGTLDYASVGGLSAEIRQKLNLIKPATLGAAGRIPGMTPAAMVAVLRHVRGRKASDPPGDRSDIALIA